MSTKKTEGRNPAAGAADYVAFLRGINVGGRGVIPMAELRSAFEALGFKHVRTVLASGNVVFSAPGGRAAGLDRTIGPKLKDLSGRDIGVILRTHAEIRALVASRPFDGVKVTPDTRLYVTFLKDESPKAQGFAFEDPEIEVRMFGLSDREIGSVLVLSPERGTPELMRLIEQEFGRTLTTRNWNTIEKIASI
jgi:uncharacterized protein (DUF1697 family)